MAPHYGPTDVLAAHGQTYRPQWISDFSFALDLPKVEEGRSLFTAVTFARSEGYFPSELTSGKYSPKSDVYSYGVVSYCSIVHDQLCTLIAVIIGYAGDFLRFKNL